jgi:transcriptional regulator with XRE-family HTH domain
MSEQHVGLPGSDRAGTLTVEDIRKHLGGLIADRREALRMSQDEVGVLVGYSVTSARKSMWSLERGDAWPPARRLRAIERTLGFREGVLDSFTRYVGSAADLSQVTVDGLMESLPDASVVGFAGVSDSTLIKELADRLRIKDEQISALQAELAAHTQGAFDLAAHTAVFKAALEDETRGS